MDIFSLLKSVGGVLATITTLVYLSGYLALRTRALTLGTDPYFSLVYEGYVFAGFRFVFVSLLLLLILAPVLFAVYSGASWLSQHLPDWLFGPLQWIFLVLLAIFTLCAVFQVVRVHGVLLHDTETVRASFLERTAVGGEVAALGIMSLILLTVSLSALWLKSRLAGVGSDPLTLVLAMVVALQVILSPMVHGALYADRKVRVLTAVPEVVKGFKEPVGIVDRTSDHATLLGVNDRNEKALVTVKLENLNGIPIGKIVPLSSFVGNHLLHARGKGESAVVQVSEKTADAKSAAPDKGSVTSFFQRVMSTIHGSILNIGSLSDSAVQGGAIFSVQLSPSGVPAKADKITGVDEFAWPILAPNGTTIYAVRQEKLVKIEAEQPTSEVDRQKRWIKLFGVTADGEILGLVLEDGERLPATRMSDGTLVLGAAPKTAEERRLRAIFEQENRAYADNISLFVDRSTKGGRGFDVFLKQGDTVHNLSNCGDDACGHPFFSPDTRRVLFVRKSRY